MQPSPLPIDALPEPKPPLGAVRLQVLLPSC